MDTQKRELWDRLENEPERAYRAFEAFLSLPSNERTLLAAYRQHVGNPDAAKPSDTWSGWCNTFAWRERAAAYDNHLASLRRDAYERAIEEEAGRYAREVERSRYRCNELLMLGYERAIAFLEDAQPSDLRFQDVSNVIRLHMDYLKAFGVQPEPSPDDDWTEEDDAELERIAKRVKARRNLEEGGQAPGEQDAASEGTDEDSSEESEVDET